MKRIKWVSQARISLALFKLLECGFGMGISAHTIQSFCPTEHVIIEFNKDIFKRLMMFKQKAQHKVYLAR